MEPENYFEIIDGVHRGRSAARQELNAGPAEYSVDQLWTYIVVGTSPDTNGEVVARLPGIWTPGIGAIVQLAEPNRDAAVYAHVYAITAGHFASVVYIEDPMEDEYEG